MKNRALILLLVVLSSEMRSQISCTPKIGDSFKPTKAGVNFRVAPSMDSEIAFQSPDPGEIWLGCTKDGFTNDFVQVKVDLIYSCFSTHGMNKKIGTLYSKLLEEHELSSFKEFFEKLWDSTKVRALYDFLMTSESTAWFKDWTPNESFDAFYEYWIYYDRAKSDEQFIVNNNERIVYVHKSVIEKNYYVFTLVDPSFTSDNYKNKLDKLVYQESQNDCDYSSTALYMNLKQYIQKLIEEENYYQAVKDINVYEPYFKTSEEKYQIDYLRMTASYHDGNKKGALALGKSLIQAYKQKKITNEQEIVYGDVDMAEVYGYTISCLLETRDFNSAITLSSECLNNENLQFNRLSEFYAIGLLNLDRKVEACDFLNKAYLDGDENARTLLLKHCN